jgi:hypothetical protein
MNSRARQIYKPEFRFGLGGVSLGNEFNKHPDKDAEATLEAAWAVGVRYFDVAPPGMDSDFRSAASVTFCTTRVIRDEGGPAASPVTPAGRRKRK